MNKNQNLVNSNFLDRVQKQDLDGVKTTLEELGANINTEVLEGSSSIHLLLENQNPSIEILEYLIEKGADINKKNKSGKTPIEIAAINYKPNVAIELLKHCPKISSADLSTLKHIINFNNNTSISLPCKIKNISNLKAAVNELAIDTQPVLDLVNKLDRLEVKYNKSIPGYCLDESNQIEQTKSCLLAILPSNPYIELGLKILNERQGNVSEKSCSIDEDKMERFKSKDIDVNSLDQNGLNLFDKAVINEDRDLVRELLKYKPKFNFTESSKLSDEIKAEKLLLIQEELLLSLLDLDPYEQDFCIQKLWDAYDKIQDKELIKGNLSELNVQEDLFVKIVPKYFNKKFQTGYKCEQEKIKDLAFLNSLEPCSEVEFPFAQLLLDVQNNIGRMLLYNLSKSPQVNRAEESAKSAMDENIGNTISQYLFLPEQAQAISLVAGLSVSQICPKEDVIQKLKELAEIECTGQDSLDSAT